ncbi:MAG: DUF92 domain-containing protein [Thermoplasmatota archaeon]
MNLDPLWLLVLVLTLAGLALAAYSLRALDGPGAVAAFTLGLIVAAAGGLDWLATFTTFTLLGFVATRIGRQTKKERRVEEARGGERGVSNVIANGAAAALAAIAALMVDPAAAALAFTTAVAAVTADTLASEVGVLSKAPRRILPPFQRLPPGANGGVSWLGQAAAATGAIIIAAVAVALMGLPWQHAWVPVLFGFAGCQVDSVLGATLERDDVRDGVLSKGDVNFIASFVVALIVLVAALLV